MRLLPAEKTISLIILALLAIDLSLLAAKSVQVDAGGYLALVAIASSLIVAGQYYRFYRPSEEGIALATTGAGLFTLFTIAGSVFNYMLLPLPFARIDETLVSIDRWLGYDWVALVHWIAGYPLFGEVLRYVYASSLPQLIVLVLLLGFTRQEQQLHRFLLTGLIGALICIFVWSILPSTGASGSRGATDALNSGFHILVGPQYNAEVNRAISESVTRISPTETLGLIGFPSFHTVMACMSVYFVPRYKMLLAAFVLINALMIPAVLIHSGHHLMDVIGGFAVFGIAAALARKAVSQAHQLRGNPGVPAPQWS